MQDESVRIPIRCRDLPSYSLFACDPPDLLYHYTSYEGANGIITNKALWLTKLSYLNDTTELKLAIDLFQREASRIAKEIKDREQREFLEKAAHQLESFSEVNICAASFCEDGDLLSQWRAYGQKGNGIALGFNGKSFKNLSNIKLWKCIYKQREHLRIVGELVETLLKSYNVILKGRIGNRNWGKTKSDLIGYFNSTFLQVAPILKNSHFHEEKEWRLITVPMPFTDKNYDAKITNHRVLQCYILNFDLIDKGEYTFLEKLVIGPTKEPGLVSDAFGVLSHKYGFYVNEISCSSVPYRSA